MTTVSLCEKGIHISFFRIIFSHNACSCQIDSRALSAVIVVVKRQSTCMSVWGGGGNSGVEWGRGGYARPNPGGGGGGVIR